MILHKLNFSKKMGIKQLLGKKIKRVRQQRGLTQEQLSEKADISLRALGGIERGVNFLTAETLDKIIEVLNITPSELFNVEHLKDTETIANELIEKIKNLKQNPEKLEEVYNVVIAMTNKP